MTPEPASIEAAWAENATKVAQALNDGDGEAVATSMPLGDGRLVLSGPGLYVNRVFGLGLRRAVDDGVFAELEEHSAKIGVPPSLDVLPAADASVAGLAAKRGYQRETELDVLVADLGESHDLDLNSAFVVVEVQTRGQLEIWQEVSAVGWDGREGPERTANDTYAAAAFAAGETLLIARASDDDRPLGCAAVVPRGDIATLGGMATLPEERRRGVQAELIRVRLDRARRHGCAHAVTTAMTGGASARNLRRLGFDLAYRKQIWTKPAVTSGA